VDNVLIALHGVNWKRLGKKLFSGDYARLSHPKLDEIEQQYKCDDDCLRAVIESWLRGPSWRRIIYELDGVNETRIADNIRHFAEPVPGTL